MGNTTDGVPPEPVTEDLMPPSEAPPEAPVTTNRMSRLWRDPVVLGLAIGAAVLLVALVVFVSLSTANYNEAVAAQDERDEYAAQVEDLEAKVVSLEDAVDRYKPAYDQSSKLTAKENTLVNRESVVEAREAAAEAAAADVSAREAAVQAREDAVKASAEGYWWVTQVQECLARPGSYRMASATEGSLGRDVSCMSG